MFLRQPLAWKLHVLIDVLCAASRGRLVLERFFSLAPNEQFRVFSFKEDQGEPLFFDDIKQLAAQLRFRRSKLASPRLSKLLPHLLLNPPVRLR